MQLAEPLSRNEVEERLTETWAHVKSSPLGGGLIRSFTDLVSYFSSNLEDGSDQAFTIPGSVPVDGMIYAPQVVWTTKAHLTEGEPNEVGEVEAIAAIHLFYEPRPALGPILRSIAALQAEIAKNPLHIATGQAFTFNRLNVRLTPATVFAVGVIGAWDAPALSDDADEVLEDALGTTDFHLPSPVFLMQTSGQWEPSLGRPFMQCNFMNLG